MAKPKIKGNIYMVFKSFCSTNPDVVVSESDVVYQNINDPKFYVEQTKIFQDTEEKYVYVCELNSSVVVQALKYEWIKLFSVE
jgi:hypothetical protein